MSPLPTPTGSQAAIGRLVPSLPLIALAVSMMAPRGSVLTFFCVALVPVAVLLLWHGLKASLTDRPEPLRLALLVFGVYLTLNATWSISRGEAFGKVAFYWVLLAVSWLAAQGISRLDDPTLRSLNRGVMIGVAVGASFLLIEVLSGQWIKRTLFNLLPVTRPDPKHLQVKDREVVYIGGYVLNRSFAVLCFALWPTLLMLRTYLDGAKARVAGLLLVAITAVGVFQSDHETSMLSLVFASMAFVGMVAVPRLMKPLIIAGWIAATMLVVPIAVASYSAGLHQASWIPETGRNRIILWSVTASKISQAPILGIGVAATKDLDEKAAQEAETRQGHTYPQRTGRHAHNIFMQTWYELGAAGALLLLAVGLLILRSLSRLPSAMQPYAFASFVGAVLIGAFSWGIWQTWFMAAFGLWALLLLLAIEAGRRDGTFIRR